MSNYQGISLPKEMLETINKERVGFCYSSTTDFIKQAIRHELERLEKRTRRTG